MTKKIWFYLTGSAIATTIIVSAIFWLNINKQYQNANVLDHISSQTSGMVKIQGLATYKSTMDSLVYASDFEAIFFSSFDSTDLALIKNTLENLPELKELLERPIYISYHTSPKDLASEELIAIKLNHPGEKKGLESIMQPMVKEAFKGEQHTVYALNRGNKGIIYSSISGGILYFGASKDLITRAIELPKEEALSANAGFMDIYRTMSTTQPISMIVQPALADSKFNLFSNSNEKTGNLVKQARWLELDLSFKENSIQGNGFLKPEETSFTAMVLRNSPSGTITLDSVMPHNIARFMLFSKDTRGMANQNFANYLRANKLFEQYTETNKQLATVTGGDREGELSALFNAEMAMYTINYNGKPENCLVVAIPDSSDYLTRFKAVFSPSTEIKENRLNLVNGVSITYFESELKNEELLFLNNYFPGVRVDFYCQYNQTVLMAASPDILEQNIISRLQRNTLRTDAEFDEVAKQLSSNQQLFIFRRALLGSQGQNSSQTGRRNPLENFGEAAFQLSTINDLMYLSMMVKYNPNRAKEIEPLWQIKPDNLLVKNPTRVINHNTKEDETIFSDKDNNLYLANNQGLILWKKPAGKGIIGEITQIDYFRNRKLQYLFNDADHIYVIDRNGNHVAPFPIKLPVKASNGVACFDYDKDGNYRFAVAGEDCNIYVFDSKGQRLKEFKAPTTDQPIRTQLQHFRSSGKDYLVFQDGKKIYITDRRGTVRAAINSSITPNANSTFHLIKKDTKEASIITTTNKNEWLRIYLATGKTEIKSVFFEQNHQHHFLHIPSKNKFVMLLAGKILLLNEEGEVEFTTESGSNQIAEAAVLDGSRALELIAYRDSVQGKIFLIDHNGVARKGFPIQGNSLVAILKNGADPTQQTMVYCNPENIICSIPAAQNE